VNCQHATLLIGADPYATSPELSEHLQSCRSCAEFQREMLGLEANIRRALEGAPPEIPADRPKARVSDIRDAQRAASVTRRRTRHTGWRGWAVAASVALVVLAALWVARPSDTLAHDVVLHVTDEPNSWDSTQPVDTASLAALLRKTGVVDSNVTSQSVMYAQRCLFRGHFVSHLVIRTASGPITVMLLPDEHVTARKAFHESGYSGVIVPTDHGSIAVLARGATNVDNVAQQTWFTVGPTAPPQ
jgi:hypothetical protein